LSFYNRTRWTRCYFVEKAYPSGRGARGRWLHNRHRNRTINLESVRVRLHCSSLFVRFDAPEMQAEFEASRRCRVEILQIPVSRSPVALTRDHGLHGHRFAAYSGSDPE